MPLRPLRKSNYNLRLRGKVGGGAERRFWSALEAMEWQLLHSRCRRNTKLVKMQIPESLHQSFSFLKSELGPRTLRVNGMFSNAGCPQITLRERLFKAPSTPNTCEYQGSRLREQRERDGFPEEGVQKGEARRKRWRECALDKNDVQRPPESHILKGPKS